MVAALAKALDLETATPPRVVWTAIEELEALRVEREHAQGEARAFSAELTRAEVRIQNLEGLLEERAELAGRQRRTIMMLEIALATERKRREAAERCPECEGTGRVFADELEPTTVGCGHCGGRGRDRNWDTP